MGSYTNIAYGHNPLFSMGVVCVTSDLLKLLFSAIGCQQHLRFLLSVLQREFQQVAPKEPKIPIAPKPEM